VVSPASFEKVATTVDEKTTSAIEWLVRSDEPGIRFQARRDLLDDEDERDAQAILGGPKVRALLAGQQADGGFGGHPYKKWYGAHWRLISLVELGVPADDPRVRAAAERELTWLDSPAHKNSITTIDGLTRHCASEEGNALAVCSRLGLARDPRVEMLATWLAEWQWPDGGWNCDRAASGRRSSFYESLCPAWGLHEYWRATRKSWAKAAAGRAAELFLSHRLFRATADGSVINKKWLVLHYPPYWRYDILQALLILARLGKARDRRAGDALDILEQRRRPDGRWQPGGYWWALKPGQALPVEVVDWGRSRPNEMLTLNALRVLRAAGRISVS
jgi:hypothetical protein